MDISTLMHVIDSRQHKHHQNAICDPSIVYVGSNIYTYTPTQLLQTCNYTSTLYSVNKVMH